MSPLAVLVVALPCVFIWLVPDVVGSVGAYLDVSSGGEVTRAACAEPACLVKCCGQGRVLFKNRTKGAPPGFTCTPLTTLHTSVDYNKTFVIYEKNIAKKKSVNKTMGNFRFVTNDQLTPNNTNIFLGSPTVNRLFIIEDGTMVMEHPHFYDRWTYYKRLEYCVEILVSKRKDGTFVNVARIGMLKPENVSAVGEIGLNFAVTGYTVSCVFMCLVLAVHGAVAALRNIAGMMRVGYVLTLTAMYVTKAAQITGGKYGTWTTSQCIGLSTTTYFLFLSSFFWLNVMSFDIWWTFRGTRKCRAIHRRGETVKFLWYCLYAWGSPLAVTALAFGIDRWATDPAVVKIQFDKCFKNEKEVLLFMYVPVIIMTAANCVLFLMTVYNIWLVKHAARQLNSKDSQTTQKNQSIFKTYLKLSLLMGTSWVLDIIQFLCDIGPWTFYVFTFYNLFIGIPIFIIFVVNRRTILMLCRRFGINNRYLDRMTSTSNGRTTTATESFKSTKATNTLETQLDIDQKEALVSETNL